MPDIQVYDLEGKVVGKAQVPAVLEGPVNEAVLWQAVRMYLANRRQGNADTKRIGDVSGGGRKPWRQKHTGRARAGSIRSPLWRHGGIVFGPHPRDYGYSLSPSVRRTALVNSLRDKLGSEAVTVVKSFDGLAPKTKALAHLLKKLQAERKTLVVAEQPSSELVRSARNLPGVEIRPGADVTCYDVLASDKVVVAFDTLKRWEGWSA